MKQINIVWKFCTKEKKLKEEVHYEAIRSRGFDTHYEHSVRNRVRRSLEYELNFVSATLS